MNLVQLTLRVMGEVALITCIWCVIIFSFITACCFLNIWKNFFNEYLERRKARALKFQTVDSYFTLMGYDLDDGEIEHLEKRARELSNERKMFVKDDNLFHESILRSAYLEWSLKDVPR